MRLKLDENLGRSCAAILREAGHDVATVHEQNLCSAPDGTLMERCREEHRCMVSLDLEFANPLLFKPSDYDGIAVLRPRKIHSRENLLALTRLLARWLSQQEIKGSLWIVQPGRVRIYQQENIP